MIKTLTESQVRKTVLAEDGKVLTKDLVLLDFYADWCGPCKEMYTMLKQVDKDFDITIYKVDVEEAKELVQTLGIRGIPSLYLINGDKVSVTSGLMPIDKLIDWIKASSE